MARANDSSTAALLLAQRICDVETAPLKATEFWQVLDAVGDPAALFGRDGTAIAEATSLPPDVAARVAARLDVATAFAIEREHLEQSGIRLASPIDEGYPRRLTERLGHRAPPILYVAGDIGLLSHSSVGIVGSRDVGVQAADVAREAAQLTVRHGHAVVSGGARGVDQLAIGAALEVDGDVIAVLADSLERTLREPQTRQAVIDGRLCLCTPYKPSAGFSVANAMARNKVIYALSDATLVVASEHEKGGTWAGAIEALKGGFTDVAVWAGPDCGSGNPVLIERGGRAVPSTEQLFPLIARPVSSNAGPEDASQLALDV